MHPLFKERMHLYFGIYRDQQKRGDASALGDCCEYEGKDEKYSDDVKNRMYFFSLLL